MYYPRFTKVIIHHFMTKKPSIPRQNKVNWHYVRDDILFSTIKVVSRHQNTQQYGAILPIELTTEEIRNTKAYKEYYASATGEAAPKPKASARRKIGGSDSSTTLPTPIATPTPITTIVAAPRLITAAKGKQPARATSPTDPTKHGGFSTDEGTGSKPRVPDVPSDDAEEEISWNSSDDEDVDPQDKDRDNDEGKKNDESDEDDDNDDEEEIAKIDEPKDTESGRDDKETKSDGESEEEETREEEEESFDLIRRTPKDSEDDGNGEEDQADLSEMELKKILIDKMEGNKSIQRLDEQQNLYKAIEGPSAGSDRGSKRRRECGEHASASTPSKPATRTTRSVGRSTTGTQSRQMSASESAFAEEPVQTTCQMDEPLHPVFETGVKDQPIVQTSQHPEWFSQPRKPPTPDRDGNKTLPAIQGSGQSWISELAEQADARSSFNKLLDTPLDFSNFIMNRLDVNTLTPELLAGPTYELMRGLCNSLTELEYHLEEVYKAMTDQLDWVNPEGQQYPHNLLQPLPLIPYNRGRRVIPFAHFINNDLEYLRGGKLTSL
nr:hypothetical protein [Tanacetum cinerariifolium]